MTPGREGGREGGSLHARAPPPQRQRSQDQRGRGGGSSGRRVLLRAPAAGGLGVGAVSRRRRRPRGRGNRWRGRNGRARVRDASVSSNPIVWDASGARAVLPQLPHSCCHQPRRSRRSVQLQAWAAETHASRKGSLGAEGWRDDSPRLPWERGEYCVNSALAREMESAFSDVAAGGDGGVGDGGGGHALRLKWRQMAVMAHGGHEHIAARSGPPRAPRHGVGQLLQRWSRGRIAFPCARLAGSATTLGALHRGTAAVKGA
eukprot:gene13890-biopygen20073